MSDAIPEPSMWDAGVDYLRITLSKGDAGTYGYNQLINAAGKVASVVYPFGEREQAFGQFGYRGFRVGNVGWGEGAEGYLLQASGLAARELFNHRVPYTNVPRIDVQITLWYASDTPGIARQVADMVVQNGRGKRGRPLLPKLYDTYGQGDTCYIGRRGNSSRFARVYDKWRESKRSKEYKYAWRFEVELADEHARDAFGTLLDLPKTHWSAASYTQSIFRRWGVSLPTLEGATILRQEDIPKPMATNERRLHWLRTHIAPTLARMQSEGVGAEEIVSALGLTRDDVLRAYLHKQ